MAFRIFMFCALLACAWPAEAQQQPVTLRFSNGLVSLRAQNAPLRAILAEWSRLGGTTIVNGERVTGAPITLELTDVPERQALDIVLRTVAGYMLGPRPAGSTGASAFDRIMILPTSVAPRNPPPPAATAAAAPAVPRPVMQRPPVQRPLPPGADPNDQPGPDDVPVGADPRDPDQADGTEPGITVVGTPTNPFGVPAGSSTRPGVVAPAPRPQPAQPNRVQ
jgi:hypothetical protein